MSKISLCRHEAVQMGGGGHCSSLSKAIDFQATYALFVCTDTLECKLVKCEVHHLSPTRPRLIFPGLIST